MAKLTDDERAKLLAIVEKAKDQKEEFQVQEKTVSDVAPEGDKKDEVIAALKADSAKKDETIDALLKYVQEPESNPLHIQEEEQDAAAQLEAEMPCPYKEKDLDLRFRHFALDVYQAGVDGRNASDDLKAWDNSVKNYEQTVGKATMTVSDAEEGGYLVPPAVSEAMLERVKTESDVFSNAVIIPMAVPKLEIPLLEDFDESQGVVDGNVLWQWIAEGDQNTNTNIKLGKVELELFMLSGQARISNRLLKYSKPSVDALVSRSFERGLRLAMNKAVLRGTGAGQPLGVIGHNATIPVAKEGGQAADSLVYDNVLEMMAVLYSADDGLGSGIWYANKNLFPQMGKLSLAVGAGGSGVFLVNGQIQGAPALQFLGLALRLSRYMSSKGDAGDIGLFDWTQYLIGQPTGQQLETAQSIHLRFDYNESTFRFNTEMGGMPWWPEKYTPLFGDQQSPFVTLAERA